MPNCIAPAPARATPARPKAVQPSPSPAAAPAVAAAIATKPSQPEPVTAFGLLERMQSAAVHWWSIIDAVLEVNSLGQSGKDEPLPQWAVDRLKDKGQHRASYDQHRLQRDMLHEMLRLSDGLGSAYRYEVWEDRNRRLSLRHESVGEALEALDQIKDRYPTAFIARLHVRDLRGYSTDISLLDTMIGRVFLAGRTIGLDDENTVELQDETGRTAMLKVSQLRGHKIVDQLSERAKVTLQDWMDHDDYCTARRKAKKGQA